MSPYTKSKKFNKSGNHRGLFILNTIFFLLIFCLVFFYLFQANNLVRYSYQIRKDNQYFNELKERNENLKNEIVQLKSPINLDEIVQSFGMVETDNIVYLGKEKTVALSR